MILRDWMFKNNYSSEKLAKKIGCSSPFIAKLRRGKGITLAMKYIYKIEQVSKGEVLFKDIVLYEGEKNQIQEDTQDDS